MYIYPQKDNGLNYILSIKLKGIVYLYICTYYLNTLVLLNSYIYHILIFLNLVVGGNDTLEKLKNLDTASMNAVISND